MPDEKELSEEDRIDYDYGDKRQGAIDEIAALLPKELDFEIYCKIKDLLEILEDAAFEHGYKRGHLKSIYESEVLNKIYKLLDEGREE